MADDITLNSGTGGATLAADDIGGVHHQRVKIQYGADGAATDVSDSNPLPIDDAGGSITIDNAALAVTGGGVEATALRVTLASDSTGLVSVDDGGSSLTVDNADLSTLAGAVAGSEMQVDIVAALPAGTNAIGKLAANSGVDIGDVDVLSMPGTAAEGAALPSSFIVVAADDGTDTVPLQATAGGDLKVTLDSETVVLGAGSAAIGKLAANSGVDIGDVDVTSAPARDRTTDNMGAALCSDALMIDATVATPAFAAVNVASSGNNTLIAASSGNKIRVTGCMLVADGNVTVTFQDGAGGTALSGDVPLTQFSGFTLPFSPVGWMEGGNNTLLNLSMDGAVSVDGVLTYILVPA